MPQKMFVFDIDQTLLSDSCSVEKSCLNDVPKVESNCNPYKKLASAKYSSTWPASTKYCCYTLQKEKMTAIMQNILKNGDKIAFITGGPCEKADIKEFCKSEFKIELPEEFYHFNNTEHKAETLKSIARMEDKNHEDLILIDNSRTHIAAAKAAGFSTVYVDNNGKYFGAVDNSNGTHYIESLNNINLYHQECDFQITDQSLNALVAIKKSKKPEVTNDFQTILQYIGKRSGNDHNYSGYLSHIGSFFGTRLSSSYSKKNKLETANAMIDVINGKLTKFTDNQVTALENGNLKQCYCNLSQEARDKIDLAIANSPTKMEKTARAKRYDELKSEAAVAQTYCH